MGSHQLLLWDFSNKATTNNNNTFGNISGDFATKFSIIWKTVKEIKEKDVFSAKGDDCGELSDHLKEGQLCAGGDGRYGEIE